MTGVKEKLAKIGFWGTIDRLERELITEQQATDELNGIVGHLKFKPFSDEKLYCGLSWSEIQRKQQSH